MVKCPAHPERTASLSLAIGRNGRPLFHDFGNGCDWRDIVRAAKLVEFGLWPELDPVWREICGDLPTDGRGSGRAPQTSGHGFFDTATAPQQIDDAKKRKRLQDVLGNLYTLDDLGLRYLLETRGLAGIDQSPVLFSSPRLYHEFERRCFPGIVALVYDMDGAPIDVPAFAVQRTFLDVQTANKIAKPAKQRLALGPVKGRAIHLTEPTRIMAIGEGIETSWSLKLIVEAEFDIREPVGCWATIGSGNLKRNLELPPLPYAEVVFIAVDLDANNVGRIAATQLKCRLQVEGREVHLLDPSYGKDMNDALLWVLNGRGM
jgi:hypothetical protein